MSIGSMYGDCEIVIFTGFSLAFNNVVLARRLLTATSALGDSTGFPKF